MSYNKIPHRTEQWSKWHNNNIDAERVSNLRDTKEQFRLLTEMTLISNKKDINIIEIGPANGTLCKQLISMYDNIASYTLVDDITMLDKCRKQLRGIDDYVNYIEIESLDTLENQSYDLIISCHCLAETPHSYRKYVYETFFPNCKELFILDDISQGKYFNKDDDYLSVLTSHAIRNFDTIILTNGHKYSYPLQKVIHAK